MDLGLVTNLNNRGVALFQEGKSKEAFRLLRSALTGAMNDSHVHQAKISKGEQEGRDFPSSAFEPSASYNSAISLESTPALTNMTVAEKIPFFDNASALAMFDRAFLVDSPGQDKQLLSGLILYNIALIVHILAKDSYGLSKALSLYNASLEIVRNCEFQPPHLLLIALHNNSAQIHSHNCCMQGTGRSLQELDRLLTRELQVSIKQEDCAIFYLNVVLLYQRKQNSTSAPAA
jgi:tetratricopeptide (TPR) repeat protein